MEAVLLDPEFLSALLEHGIETKCRTDGHLDGHPECVLSRERSRALPIWV